MHSSPSNVKVRSRSHGLAKNCHTHHIHSAKKPASIARRENIIQSGASLGPGCTVVKYGPVTHLTITKISNARTRPPMPAQNRIGMNLASVAAAGTVRAGTCRSRGDVVAMPRKVDGTEPSVKTVSSEFYHFTWCHLH